MTFGPWRAPAARPTLTEWNRRDVLVLCLLAEITC